MPAPSIDDSFVQQFEDEMKLDFQRMGSKLGNTVRKKMNVVGEQTTFQQMGKGEMGTKARNGQIPILNLDHNPRACTLADYYAGEMVDKLDELKIQHDERSAVVRTLSAAAGRKTDSLIITVVAASGNSTAHGSTGMTLTKIDGVFTEMGNEDIPDDGQRFLWVSPAGWVDLLGEDAFSNADYIGSDQLPYNGVQAKKWHSFLIAQHSGLSGSASDRSCLAYHSMAVGCASGQEAYVDITWQGKEQSHLIAAGMSQGAVLIGDSDDASAGTHVIHIVE